MGAVAAESGSAWGFESQLPRNGHAPGRLDYAPWRTIPALSLASASYASIACIVGCLPLITRSLLMMHYCIVAPESPRASPSGMNSVAASVTAGAISRLHWTRSISMASVAPFHHRVAQER